MTRRARFSQALAFLALLAATSAAAEPQRFNIDPSHSEVSFSIRHFFGKVPGWFREFSGSVVYDPADLAASSVEVTIKTASVDTRNERRDADLRSGNFFLADSFPTITFKSTKVIPGKESQFQVVGDLTMRGVTKQVTLDASFLGMGTTDMVGGFSMGTRAGWEASTVVDRRDFGVLWNKVLDKGGTMLGDEVAIHLGVEGMQTRGPAKDTK